MYPLYSFITDSETEHISRLKFRDNSCSNARHGIQAHDAMIEVDCNNSPKLTNTSHGSIYCQSCPTKMLLGLLDMQVSENERNTDRYCSKVGEMKVYPAPDRHFVDHT